MLVDAPVGNPKKPVEPEVSAGFTAATLPVVGAGVVIGVPPVVGVVGVVGVFVIVGSVTTG
jgi:hypothetical protein